MTPQEEAWNKFCQEVMPDPKMTYALRGTFGTVFKRAWDEATQAVREEMIRDGWRHCAEGQDTTQYRKLFKDAVKAERERAWGKGFDHALDLLARHKVKKSKARSEKWKWPARNPA
jgi:hypothetical protein